MKIVKQSAIELVLWDGDRFPLGLMCWLVGVTGVLVFLLSVTVANAGITQLDCYRLKSAEVSCEYRQSQAFDLIQSTPMVFQNVTKVHLDEQVNRNTSDAYAISRVALSTRQGEVFLTEYTNDRQKNKSVEQALSYFMESTQSSVQVRYDRRWRLWYTVVPLVTMLTLLGIILGAIYSNCQLRLLTINRPSNRLIYQTWTLLGTRRRLYPLTAVEGIYIHIHENSLDEESKPSYEPMFLARGLPQVALLQSPNLAEARQFAERLRTFLQLPAVIEA